MSHKTMSSVRLAILDDNVPTQIGLKRMFETAGYTVCAVCGNLDDFLQQVKACQPDVAIVDLRVPRDGKSGLCTRKYLGLEAIEEMREVSPSTKTVIYTFHPYLDNFDRALRLGVLGFVQKEPLTKQKKSLVEIVRDVASGYRYWDEGVFQDYLSVIDPPSREVRSAPIQPQTDTLTDREREVLKLAGKDLSQEQIAEQLVISIHTVRTHCRNARAKLGVHSTEEAVVRARTKGLL